MSVIHYTQACIWCVSFHTALCQLAICSHCVDTGRELSVPYHIMVLLQFPGKDASKYLPKQLCRVWKLLCFLKWLGNVDISVWIPTWVHGRILLSYSMPGAGTFVCASLSTVRSQIYSAEQQQHLRAEVFSLSVPKPTWRHCIICNGGLDRSTCAAHGQPASEPGAEAPVTANPALRVRDTKWGRREVGNLVLFIEVMCCLKPWLMGSSPWR